MTLTGQGGSTERLHHIDRAKGLGIVLVVWGHLAGQSTGAMPLWFYISVDAIYTFHMPLFMYLSGFVYFLIGAPERFWARPGTFVGKRFDRLMIPFLVFAALVVIGKHFAGQIGPVDDPVDSIPQGFAKVVVNARDNPSISIWYLLVLFIYSVFTPILWRMGRRSMALLFLIGGLGWLFPLPEIFYIRRVAVYFIFFVVGGVVAIHREAVLPVMARWWWLATIVSAIACWFLLGRPVALLCCGLMAPLAVHGLFLQRWWDGDALFLTLGRYSMAIYLMNSIFIGLATIGFKHAMRAAGWTIPFLLALFAIGVVGPMLVRRVLAGLPRLRFLSRYLE